MCTTQQGQRQGSIIQHQQDVPDGLSHLSCRAKASGRLEAQDAEEVLRKLLYLASRAEEKPASQAAAGALLYALRYIPSAQAQQVGRFGVLQAGGNSV